LTRPRAVAPRLLLTARQAAEALAISPRTLWELTARGDLPAMRLPGRGKPRALRYAVEDLQLWIQSTKDAQKIRLAKGNAENQAATPLG
jgi:excisionase family DNA binding protein